MNRFRVRQVNKIVTWMIRHSNDEVRDVNSQTVNRVLYLWYLNPISTLMLSLLEPNTERINKYLVTLTAV